MAQEYIELKNDEEYGKIAVNKSVFQAISEISIKDVENARIIPTTRFSKPIGIKIQQNELTITADVKVKYGINVNATCELVQNKIYENIAYMTGYKPTDITVNVIGFITD